MDTQIVGGIVALVVVVIGMISFTGNWVNDPYPKVFDWRQNSNSQYDK